MATDGRSAPDADTNGDAPEPAHAGLASAGFVRLVVRADGDALAASGLVARALSARGTPFQLTVGSTIADRTERASSPHDTDEDVTLAIGAVDDTTTAQRLDADDRPATLAAVDAVRDLGETPDHVLALAGLVAAGVEPGAGESEWVLESARERGLVERRSGVAIPTADPVDGLAHSTRVCAPWSGDVDAVRTALADAVDLDTVGDASTDDQHRPIASLAALDAVSDEDATDVAATAIQRVLRPYATPEGPFETVGGYADVLEATARTEPGTGAALAMGHDAREPALDAWRAYGRRAHEALDTASTGRYDGLYVLGVGDEGENEDANADGSTGADATISAPVDAVARIAAAYRSPEPDVLVVGAGEAALVTRMDDGLGPALEGVARELDCECAYDVGRRDGYLRYDRDVDDATIIAAVREFR